MSSWLSDRLGIHLNLRPLAAPAGAVVGGLLGGPAGAALGAGLFKTADNKFHGDSWDHALGQGVLNGAGTYVGGQALGKLRSMFGGGEAAGSFVPSSGGVGPLDGGSGPGGSFVSGAAAGPGMTGGDGVMSSLSSGARNVGSFIKDHPGAVAGSLQGVSQLGSMGAENAQRKAQTRAIELSNTQTQSEMDAKKRRDAALAPLMALFQGQVQQMQAHPYAIAHNPYT